MTRGGCAPDRAARGSGPTVRRLPEAVANQIAAGEVVERPASVVRELVENSIDAAATRVAISVSGGGQAAIRVSDDGLGMTPEDARLALERHATSKIRSADDLSGIGSLGFRGEALPSIAAVSRFRLRTRPPGAESGWEIRVEGGETVADRPAGVAPGAVIDVRDLFWNTPARRKFLRSDNTETARMARTVERLAAAWPQVRFDFESNGRKALAVSAVSDRSARLQQLEPRWFPDAIAAAAVGNGFAVHAWLSPPMAPRSRAPRLVVFVNGRPVSDRGLFHAVTAAYRELSSLAGTPKAYVFLEAEPEAVDVNVHPAKSEVRFADASAAWRAVHQAVVAGLDGGPRKVTLDGPTAYRHRGDSSDSPAGGGAGGPASGSAGGAVGDGDRGPLRADGREAADLLYGRSADGAGAGPAARYLDFGKSPPRVLGQFRRTYVVAEDDSGLLLVDQHAAEERVVFNALMERPEKAGSVPLLIPAPLDLSAAERSVLAAERERLAAAGFEIEPFGADSWILREVPEALGVGAALAVLTRSLAIEEEECVAGAVRDARARMMARVACHASITANTLLTADRMERLVARLWGATRPSTCPHGRPTVLRVDLASIERGFRRR